MADESVNGTKALIKRQSHKLTRESFSESDYQTAARELNIRRPQLDRCKHLATLGRSTYYVNKHDQNLGTLVWTREQIMEDINRVDTLIDENSQRPPEYRLDGDAIVHLMQTKAKFYQLLSESVVPNIEHLGDRKEKDDSAKQRQKTFAPGSNVTAVFVGGKEPNHNGANSRVVIDAINPDKGLS